MAGAPVNQSLPLLLDGAGVNQLVRGRHGYFLFNRNDVYIGRSLALYGEYSEHEVLLFDQICRAGDVVVEVGANIGTHTVPLARRVGPAGRVHAFEPQPVVFQTLCANIALNSLLNVHCHNAAAGVQAGVLQVPPLAYDQPGNFGGVSLTDRGEGVPVPVVKLDDALGNLARLTLLKVDVEGMELAVLQGAAGLIRRLRPVLYVENDRADRSAALMRAMRQLGYRLHWHLPYLYNPQNYAARVENVFGNVASCNVFAVPSELQLLVKDLPESTDDSVHPMFGKVA